MINVFIGYPGIAKLGKQGLLQRAQQSMELAEYAVQQLQQAGIDAWRNDNALTVAFPQPHETLCHKWQLASENGLSHLICMPGISKQQINAFVEDCKKLLLYPRSSTVPAPVTTWPKGFFHVPEKPDL